MPSVRPSRDIGKRRGTAQGQHPHHRPGRNGLDHADRRLCGGGAIRADRDDRSRLRDEHDRQRDPVGDRYFLLQDGVWFVANSPDGPWQLASEVPDAIYAIPPSSPVYNVTYVRVYDTEPDAVWYSYTMGYLSGFLSWGTYVYGTGWYYPPTGTIGRDTPTRSTIHGRSAGASAPTTTRSEVCMAATAMPTVLIAASPGCGHGIRARAPMAAPARPGACAGRPDSSEPITHAPTAPDTLPVAATYTAPGSRPASNAGRSGHG